MNTTNQKKRTASDFGDPSKITTQRKLREAIMQDAVERVKNDPSPENVVALEEAANNIAKHETRIAKGAELGRRLNGDRADLLTQHKDRSRTGTRISYASKGGTAFARKAVDRLQDLGLKSTDFIHGNLTLSVDEIIHADAQAKPGILGLVRGIKVDEGGGQYLQQTVREHAATTVPRGEMKPESTYKLEPRQWRLSTVAHMSEPLATQWVADIPSLLGFLSGEMYSGVRKALSHLILTGGEDEDGNEVEGLLNNTGITTQTYKTSPLLSIRKALTALQIGDIAPTALAIHPAAWEEISMQVDVEGRPLFTQLAGEFPTPTLFGIPVTLVAELPEAKALIANWDAVQLLERGVVDMRASEQGISKEEDSHIHDLFRRNQVVLRAETRAALAVTQIPAVRLIELETSEVEG